MQPLWKTLWRFLKKLKIELPYDPAIALLGIYPRDTGVLFRRDTCTPMFIAALSTIAKGWKEPKYPSTDEQLMNMWCVCVCMYIYIYIYIYTHAHTYIYVYIYICVYIYTHTHIHNGILALVKNVTLPFALT